MVTEFWKQKRDLKEKSVWSTRGLYWGRHKIEGRYQSVLSWTYGRHRPTDTIRQSLMYGRKVMGGVDDGCGVPHLYPGDLGRAASLDLLFEKGRHQFAVWMSARKEERMVFIECWCCETRVFFYLLEYARLERIVCKESSYTWC